MLFLTFVLESKGSILFVFANFRPKSWLICFFPMLVPCSAVVGVVFAFLLPRRKKLGPMFQALALFLTFVLESKGVDSFRFCQISTKNLTDLFFFPKMLKRGDKNKFDCILEIPKPIVFI